MTNTTTTTTTFKQDREKRVKALAADIMALEQRLAVINARLGKGVGARRERSRIKRRISDASIFLVELRYLR